MTKPPIPNIISHEILKESFFKKNAFLIAASVVVAISVAYYLFNKNDNNENQN